MDTATALPTTITEATLWLLDEADRLGVSVWDLPHGYEEHVARHVGDAIDMPWHRVAGAMWHFNLPADAL